MLAVGEAVTYYNRGSQTGRYPLRPEMMARVCREGAAQLRKEAATGMKSPGNGMTRAKAADSMDEQAARWEAEVATGVKNEFDRRKIGLWP